METKITDLLNEITELQNDPRVRAAEMEQQLRANLERKRDELIQMKRRGEELRKTGISNSVLYEATVRGITVSDGFILF